MDPVTRFQIIGEVGSNFDGDLDTAIEYVRAINGAGADAVKFQTLRRDKLVAPKLLTDVGLVDNPVYDGFANLELPDDWHYELKRVADAEGVEFMSTPFYLEAVDLLEDVGVETYKIASGDITFTPLLQAVAGTGKRILLSTGASSLGDVDRALGVLTRAGAADITLLHCVSNYPPQWHEMNLRAITTLRDEFGLPVGISDHSPGSLVPIAAATLGASVIEKHVTFDRSLPGPDHPFAMTMAEFAETAHHLRVLEHALGSGEKSPTEAEAAKRSRLRRGVYEPDSRTPIDGSEGIWLRPDHRLARQDRS